MIRRPKKSGTRPRPPRDKKPTPTPPIPDKAITHPELDDDGTGSHADLITPLGLLPAAERAGVAEARVQVYASCLTNAILAAAHLCDDERELLRALGPVAEVILAAVHHRLDAAAVDAFQAPAMTFLRKYLPEESGWPRRRTIGVGKHAAWYEFLDVVAGALRQQNVDRTRQTGRANWLRIEEAFSNGNVPKVVEGHVAVARMIAQPVLNALVNVDQLMHLFPDVVRVDSMRHDERLTLAIAVLLERDAATARNVARAAMHVLGIMPAESNWRNFDPTVDSWEEDRKAPTPVRR